MFSPEINHIGTPKYGLIHINTPGLDDLATTYRPLRQNLQAINIDYDTVLHRKEKYMAGRYVPQEESIYLFPSIPDQPNPELLNTFFLHELHHAIYKSEMLRQKIYGTVTSVVSVGLISGCLTLSTSASHPELSLFSLPCSSVATISTALVYLAAERASWECKAEQFSEHPDILAKWGNLIQIEA